MEGKNSNHIPRPLLHPCSSVLLLALTRVSTTYGLLSLCNTLREIKYFRQIEKLTGVKLISTDNENMAPFSFLTV